MPVPKPLVANAGSPSQVKRAEREAKFRRETELAELRELLKDRKFRNFVFRFLTYTKVYNSIFEQSSKIYYNAGQQDVGHFLMAEIVEADQPLYLQMLKEKLDADRQQVDPSTISHNEDEE